MARTWCRGASRPHADWGWLTIWLPQAAISRRIWIIYVFGNPVMNRDLRATTPHGEVSLNIYHPSMQEALLERARSSGVEVKRGAKVVGVDSGPGRDPSVIFEHEGSRQTLSARVVVGADGRSSQVRGWGGFEVQRNPSLLIIAGMLIQGTDVPDDAVHLAFGPGCATLLAPLGGRRARVYYVYPGVAGRRGLSGKDKVQEFIQLCKCTGVPESWFAAAESIGPLAEFDGADRWTNRRSKTELPWSATRLPRRIRPGDAACR